MSAEQQALLMVGDAGGSPLVPSCVGDPYYTCGPDLENWDKVVLLLGCEGADGSLVLVDSSSYADNRTLTAGQGAAISIDSKKFGSASVKVTWRNPEGQSWSANRFKVIAGQPYVAEGWFRKVSVQNATSSPMIARLTDFSGNRIFDLAQYTTSDTVSVRFGADPAVDGIAYTPDADGYNHWAITYDGTNTWKLYINGTAVVTQSGYTYNSTVEAWTFRFLQAATTSSQSSEFYADEFRVTNGKLWYTGNFTPPTAAFPTDTWKSSDPRTILSIHADGPQAGDPYLGFVASAALFNEADGSTTTAPKVGPSLTRFGGPTISNEQMHFGANTYKNTSSDANSSFRTGASLSIGTGADWCIEAWAYFTGSGGYRHIVQLGSSLTNRANLAVNGGYLKGYLEGTSTVSITASVVFPSNQWVNVALIKYGSELRLFQDGVLVASSACGAFNSTSAAIFSIGTQNFSAATNDQWIGYLDDARATVGISRYFDTLAPDLQPLIFEGDPPVDQSCYQTKTLTLTGIAQISDVQAQFGSKSILVPNAGTSTLNGLVVTDHQDFGFGTGDFTIDLWAYRSANTYVGTLFYGTLGGGEFSVKVGTDGLIDLVYRSSGGSQSFSNVATWPVGEWVYFVIQRRGTNWETYLSGTLIHSSAITGGAGSTVNSGGDLYFGRTNASSAQSWGGYLDDIRVTRGAARYTADFTPPALTFCESTIDGFINGVDGAEALRGVVTTSGIGTLRVADVYVALTSVFTVSGIGFVTGQNFPNLSGSIYDNFGTVRQDAPVIVWHEFKTDGTIWRTIFSGSTTISATQVGLWIDNTSVSIPAIAGQYVFSAGITYGSTGSFRQVLNPTATVLIRTVSSIGFVAPCTFNVTIVALPKPSNPRYGESGYVTTFYSTFTLQQPNYTDALLSDVVLLAGFNTAQYTPGVQFISDIGPPIWGTAGITTGASDEAASFDAGMILETLSQPFWGSLVYPFTLDCAVKLANNTGLWDAGTDERYMPVVTCINPGGTIVFSLGIGSWAVSGGARVVCATFIRLNPFLSYGYAINDSGLTAGISQASATGQFNILSVCANEWFSSGYPWIGVWWNKSNWLSYVATGSFTPVQTNAILQIGGTVPVFWTGISGAPVTKTALPFRGAIDELRLTKAARYSMWTPNPYIFPRTDTQLILPWPR